MNKNIVLDWIELLSLKLSKSVSDILLTGLEYQDFSADCVELSFEDDSYCQFNNAFAIENKETKQIAIFTEHCGYHVFSSLGVCVVEFHGLTKTFIVNNKNNDK
ncbi:hypothetical protein A6E13_15775 [Aliivibrio fischeri]|uniref:hypothetical protein n=1 Tax=Aliivibrio fischeri TaxID=668 RepID=UPI00080DE1BB|nr:hypothetical protein [Aliivibrio fischeri]OCH32031.1 hypothetical protein A6E13_15775 [Aliivibrio fischeri]